MFVAFFAWSFAMKPIPTEMRKRLLDDLNSGMTWAATAQKWKISQSFIAKLTRQLRNTGSIEPIKPKTGPKPKLEPHYALLQKIVAETPDATLAEIQDLLPVKVSHQTVADALIRLKLVYKKNN
jgi:transposase